MKNFQSLMCIYLGLNLPCLSRYALMWKALHTRQTISNAFRNCRLSLRQSGKKSPQFLAIDRTSQHTENTQKTLPRLLSLAKVGIASLLQLTMLEILLKDLLYHNENTPDFVEPGVIDMRKLDSMGKMLDQFRSYQV